jgi:hypothetical protein
MGFFSSNPDLTPWAYRDSDAILNGLMPDKEKPDEAGCLYLACREVSFDRDLRSIDTIEENLSGFICSVSP